MAFRPVLKAVLKAAQLRKQSIINVQSPSNNKITVSESLMFIKSNHSSLLISIIPMIVSTNRKSCCQSIDPQDMIPISSSNTIAEIIMQITSWAERIARTGTIIIDRGVVSHLITKPLFFKCAFTLTISLLVFVYVPIRGTVVDAFTCAIPVSCAY
ncbi:MAG: hypothetical protein ACREOZ_00980 [Gloeomargaritales cyanobacterium]